MNYIRATNGGQRQDKESGQVSEHENEFQMWINLWGNLWKANTICYFISSLDDAMIRCYLGWNFECFIKEKTFFVERNFSHSRKLTRIKWVGKYVISHLDSDVILTINFLCWSSHITNEKISLVESLEYFRRWSLQSFLKSH